MGADEYRGDQAAPQVAFQGERGAYGEEAVVAYFGAQVVPVPKKSFAEAFDAVVSRETDAGLLPIENSQAGSVHDVYDLLRSGQLFVNGEICRPVNHCLLCLPGQTLGQIKRVLSHPQALAQSDAYLRGLGVEVVAAYDTAGSAKLIREQELYGVAAVASARAAELYQLEILASGIQTVKDNYTRFIKVEREPGPAPSGQAKTMLMLATTHTPGALYHVLGEFAARDINLLKLESRPSREKPWEYVFYLDIEGAPQQEPVAQALAALKRKTTFLQVLGAFPRDPAFG
ncbi:MAG TPA: prephenate dehydratase [Ktedonobacterales bacterium]|nr:prephenate dehydratase [Ktedonobacterales bacterium]